MPPKNLGGQILSSGLQAPFGQDYALSVVPAPSAPTNAPGMISPGNVNVYDRPIVPNGRDSSTVRSVSFGLDNGETLVPSVSDGEDGRKPHLLSIQPSPNDGPSEALSYYRRYGKSLGTFAHPEDADAYGQALHEQQASMQNFGGRTSLPPQIIRTPLQKPDISNQPRMAGGSISELLKSLLAKQP